MLSRLSSRLAGWFLCLLTPLVGSCAILHHVQLGDVDDRGGRGAPFDIKVNETGINLGEAVKIASAFAGKADGRRMGEAESIISMFQMGPRTGNHVYNDAYAEGLLRAIYDRCPSGRVTGLVAIRETRKYPVISGEIVKILGYCKT